MRIGFIGTGTIASAVVRGIVADGHDITVSRRSEARSAALAATYKSVRVAENQDVLDQSDTIFLGLMAETAGETLRDLTFRPDQTVVSFMAGASLDEVSRMVRPAGAAAVMMPFPGIAQGGSPIMVQGDAAVVEALFGRRNRVFALKHDQEMRAYLAAQAVLSPVAAMVGQASGWLGARVDESEQGEAFLRMLVASSLAETGCADLVESLNTPGGYNQRLRLHMERAGMGEALAAGLDMLEE